MDRVVMEHTPMSIGQGSDHGNDSEPESAVSEDLNDDDHDYEVDAIKWAIWRDSRKDRPDGFVGWHYWIMWKNYLKSQSDSEEPNSAFAEEDGKIPLLIAFWESFNRDDLRPLPGESEPAAPPKGSRNKRIQTPEAQLKKWLNATNRKRLYSTYMLRKKWEETHPGQIVPKKFSDYYSWRKRKNRKSTERLASVAASVAGSTTGQPAPTVPSTSAEPVAGRGKGKGKAKTKPEPIVKPKVKQPKPIKPKTTEQEKSAPGSLKVKIAVPQKTIPSGLASREGSTFSGDVSDLPEDTSHSAVEEAGSKLVTATLAPRGLNKGKRKAEDEVPPPKDTSSTTASSIPAKRKKTTPMATPPPQSQSQPQSPPQPQVPPTPIQPLIHKNRWTGLNKIPKKSTPALDSDPHPRFGDPEPGIFAPTQAQRSASMSEMSSNAARPSGPRPPVKPPVKSSSYCPRPTPVVNTVPTQTFTDEPLSVPFESPAEIDGNDLPGISWNVPNNASSAERPVSHSVETSPYATDRPLPSVTRSKSPSKTPAPVIDLSFSPTAQSSALPAVDKPPLTARPKYQHPSRIQIMPTVGDSSVVVRPQASPREASLTRGSAEAMSRSPPAGVTPSQPPHPSPNMGNQSQAGGTFAPPLAAPAKRQPGRPLGSKNSRNVSAEGPSPAPSPPITRPIPIFDLSKNQPARPAAPSNRIGSSSATSDPPVLPKGPAGPTKASLPPAPFKLTRPIDQPPKPGRPVAPAQSVPPGAGAFGSRPAIVEQRTQSNALAVSPSASAPPFKLAERAASTSQPAKPTEPVPPGPGAFGSRPASVEQPIQPQSRAAEPPAPAIPSSTLKHGVPDGQPLNAARSTNADSGAIDSASVSSDPPAPAKKSAAPTQALAFPPPFKLSAAGQPRHPTPPTNPGSAGFGSAPVHPEPPTHSAIASTYNASADPRRRSVPVSATPSIASPQHSVDEQTPAPLGNAPDPRSKLHTPPASPVKATSQQLSDPQSLHEYDCPIQLRLNLPKGKWMDPSYKLRARILQGSLSSSVSGNWTEFLFGRDEKNAVARNQELAFAQVSTICLDALLKLGASMTEWAAVTRSHRSDEWDNLETQLQQENQCMVAYTEMTGYRKVPTHYALILTSPELVDLSPIGIGRWKAESLPSLILLFLALPLTSPAAPVLPNPVRPGIKDRHDFKTSFLESEVNLLRSYGLDADFIKGLKGKTVMVSPAVSNWERLHSFTVKELRFHSALSSSADQASDVFLAIDTHLLRVLMSPLITTDVLPQRTMVYSFGPSIERYPSQWQLRRIWQSGGLVTFSPTFILRSPKRFLEIMGMIRSSPDWAAYIIPSVVEWLAESWDKPDRCPQPIAAYEAVCSSLFLDEDLLELSGELVTEGGGLAVSCAPPVIHDTRGCATWMDWLHATYEQRAFEGLVELCRGIRPEHFACHNKFDGTSTPLTQIDVEIPQGSDMMGMRLRPEIVPYRRYIYIGPVSMKSDQQNKAVEYVHPDDFAAIFSGAV